MLLKRRMTKNSTQSLFDEVKNKNISSLAKAITLIESESCNDQIFADELLNKVFQSKISDSFRIGISGAPGVGKSTFINHLGMSFIQKGYRVAVLAVDPSSEVTFGSILGDKTRMEELSRSESAYIRPSSSRGFLGGIHPSTRDTIRLCEVAGYNIVLVETVGVGQSEAAVSDLVDHLLLLVSPGGGDELQGIKRGILEKIDGVVVNKADASNQIAAEVTEKQIQSSLHILRDKKIVTQRVSSTEKTGFTEVVQLLLDTWSKDRESLQQKRLFKSAVWLEKYIEQLAIVGIREQLLNTESFLKIKTSVIDGSIDVRSAAQKALKSLTFV